MTHPPAEPVHIPFRFWEMVKIMGIVSSSVGLGDFICQYIQHRNLVEKKTPDDLNFSAENLTQQLQGQAAQAEEQRPFDWRKAFGFWDMKRTSVMVWKNRREKKIEKKKIEKKP